MGCPHHDYVADRGVLSQRFIAQDRAFNLLGADAVARDVDHVIGTTMECERAFITSASVVSLGVGQFAVPTLEVNLGKAVDIALPIIGTQCITLAPQRSCQVRVGLGNHQFALLTSFRLSPLADAARVAGFFNNAHLRLNPGQRPGLGVGLQRLEVTPWAREYDAAMFCGPVGIDVVRADVLHRKLLYRR